MNKLRTEAVIQGIEALLAYVLSHPQIYPQKLMMDSNCIGMSTKITLESKCFMKIVLTSRKAWRFGAQVSQAKHTYYQ